ncbi:MAG: hypothetical protein WCB04_04535, partial [Mycobacteriales bacterium]
PTRPSSELIGSQRRGTTMRAPKRRHVLIATAGLLLVATGTTAWAGVHEYRRSSLPDAEEIEAVVAAPNSSTGSCGVERWSVKTGTDADAGKITMGSTTSTTIASLDARTAPSSLPANNRVQPTETTVFRVSATLSQYKLEADSDYHLVLSDGAGHTMIAEIADPACVGSGSPLMSGIQQSRSQFDAKYTATGSFKTANVPVTVTGVGFFDFMHGQTGVAPNGIELHALTDIQFSGTGGSCSGQKLGNPGFETGTAAPWTSSAGVVSNSSSEPARTGSWDAWLDGYGAAHTDTLSQQVSIPAGCRATLTFYLHVDTAETSTTTAYDKLTVKVGTATLATYSNLNHNTGYTLRTIDLSSYAGQTVTPTFTGTEGSINQTSFVLDDSALTLS